MISPKLVWNFHNGSRRFSHLPEFFHEKSRADLYFMGLRDIFLVLIQTKIRLRVACISKWIHMTISVLFYLFEGLLRNADQRNDQRISLLKCQLIEIIQVCNRFMKGSDDTTMVYDYAFVISNWHTSLLKSVPCINVDRTQNSNERYRTHYTLTCLLFTARTKINKKEYSCLLYD